MKIDIETDVNLLWREEAEFTEDIMTLEECQSICQKRDGCSNFVWHHGSAGEWSYRCITMTGYGYKLTNTTCASGSLTTDCDQDQGN